MSRYTDEPRFTIEQIDLLQRLRRTRMTKPEILHALDTLDRLDHQNGHKFRRRLQPQPAYQGPTPNCSTNTTSSSWSDNVAASSSTSTTATQTAYLGNGSGGSGLSPSPSNNYDMSPPPPVVVSAPVAMAVVEQNGRGVGGGGGGELVAMTNGKLSPVSVSAVSGGVTGSGYRFEANEEDLDVEDKVEELLRKDSAIIKEEIKAFLGNRRISQALVAQVTGISQSRISHWLLQQGSDLSEQKKRAFYRWYQLEKTTPGNAHHHLHAQFHHALHLLHPLADPLLTPPHL